MVNAVTENALIIIWTLQKSFIFNLILNDKYFQVVKESFMDQRLAIWTLKVKKD